jgi:hypothetical protein
MAFLLVRLSVPDVSLPQLPAVAGLATLPIGLQSGHFCLSLDGSLGSS